MRGRKELLRIIGVILLLSFICSFSTSNKIKADYSPQTISVTLDWSFETDGYIASSPSIADLNADGQLEILFGSTDSKFYCLDSDGNKLWSFSASHDVRSTTAIFDINNDGDLEIVFGSNDEHIGHTKPMILFIPPPL
jgi:outer membrane protein assembly factor BamB